MICVYARLSHSDLALHSRLVSAVVGTISSFDNNLFKRSRKSEIPEEKTMNAKKLMVAAVLGTIVTVTATTQVASAAPWHRPVYRGPVYGAYWHRPYYDGGYTVTVPTPVVYDYAAVPALAPAPYYTAGVYVNPRVNFRIR
jgi:hypothetical protein